MMKNTAQAAIKALEKATQALIPHARKGVISAEQISDLVFGLEDSLKAARRQYFVSKRDPKKVKAAVKKAATTRKKWKAHCAKWAKIADAERAVREKRAAEGYLPEQVCDNRGEPDPRYYEFAYTDERSGGYRIYNLRPEWKNVPGLHHVARY